MPNVWVAGSINMDIVATATRYPKIGETVPGTEIAFYPGGKGANQAVSAAKLGASTFLIGKVGTDAFGRDLRNFFAGEKVDLTFVGDTAAATTGTALITVAEGNNAIVVVPGANALLSERDVIEPALAKGDVLVSQFEIPIPAITAFFSRAQAAGATTILNPAPAIDFDRDLLELVDVLILNETELGEITGIDIHEDDPHSRIIEAARALRKREGQTITVTLGSRGALAWVHEAVLAIPGELVECLDSTGAGDCFIGAVAARTVLGAPIEQALRYANFAASICVQRPGAGPSMPTEAEVAATRHCAADKNCLPPAILRCERSEATGAGRILRRAVFWAVNAPENLQNSVLRTGRTYRRAQVGSFVPFGNGALVKVVQPSASLLLLMRQF